MADEQSSSKSETFMTWIERAREQATQVAEKAQEAQRLGQAKFSELQAKRRADGVLRQLGSAYYADKTARGTPKTTAELERLVSELQAMEDDGAHIEGITPEPKDEGPSDSSS